MYEDQTFEEIMDRMLRNLSDDIDKREGSVAYDMLAPKAFELSIAYTELDNIINLGFAETTYGEFLDLKALEIGMSRLRAVKAYGTIRFTSGVNGLVIPQGSVVYTDSGIRFSTDSQVTIVNGTASVTITAVEGGNIGNVPANSIVNNEITDLTCVNDTSTSGGTDIETDEQLLSRYLIKVQTPASSGNVYHYKEWAHGVPGIGDAKVIPIWNGNNTVKVIVVGLDKKPVNIEKVEQVFNYIEEARPVGANVTVESAVGLTISITTTLTLSTDYNLSQVKPEIENEIVEYFKRITFVEGDVKYSRIASILLGAEGVLDYSNLKINGGTSNVPLQVNQVPVLGTVTLS